MKSHKSLVTLLGVALMVAMAAAFTAPQDDDDKPKKAELGEPAPDFVLKDVAGKEYKLSDYKGKIVVLQWVNPECPVCVRVNKTGLTEKMRKELKALDKDFVHLAINTTHDMNAEDTAKYLKEHELDIPGLDDSDGTVGKLYDARTTPHMYVIDTEGVLRYNGAFDDDPRGRKDEGVTNYVVNAVELIKAGETVEPDKTKPYGCSVKYK